MYDFNKVMGERGDGNSKYNSFFRIISDRTKYENMSIDIDMVSYCIMSGILHHIDDRKVGLLNDEEMRNMFYYLGSSPAILQYSIVSSIKRSLIDCGWGWISGFIGLTAKYDYDTTVVRKFYVDNMTVH